MIKTCIIFFLDVFKKEKVRMSSPSYVEEQQAIKDSFKGALDDNSDDEDIFKQRVKTKEEQVNSIEKCIFYFYVSIKYLSLKLINI